MPDHTKRVKTQWNSYVRPFDSFSDEEINGLLGYCSDTTRVAEKLSGKKCYLAYGALLGREREGKLIPHDFDIDVAIDCGRCSKDEVAEICRDLMVKFIEAGYEVKAKCFAQFFVLPPKEVKQRFKVEFFASWIEEEKYYLYFALPGLDLVDEIFPLKKVDLQGHEFYAPKNTEALLSATYGADWAVPNPNFKYDMSGGKWAPFTSYFYSRSLKQWDEYYLQTCSNNLSTADIDSMNHADNSNKNMLVCDMGCGQGLESIDLINAGHDVVSFDFSKVAIDYLEKYKQLNNINNLTPKALNFYDVVECEKTGSEYEGKIDLVILNNVLQHLSLVGESITLKMVSRVLSSAGEAVITIPSEYVALNKEVAITTDANKRRGIDFLNRKIFLEDLEDKFTFYGLKLTNKNNDTEGSRITYRVSIDSSKENQIFAA